MIMLNVYRWETQQNVSRVTRTRNTEEESNMYMRFSGLARAASKSSKAQTSMGHLSL